MMSVREQLLDAGNIFLAIYTVDSYVQNKDLLDEKDKKLLMALKDVFNQKVIEKTIDKVKKKLISILDDESSYFETQVYFKPKKYKDGEDVFRPLHTAKLIDQISMVAMLQILVYERNGKNELIPSELSRLVPSNFFGNRISCGGRKLFEPWQKQYQNYVSKANDILFAASKTKQYLYEITLDLENFFPSVDPKMLYYYIANKMPLTWQQDETMLTILRKLLIFKLCALDETEKGWYLQSKIKEERLLCTYAKGLPQGLPHTYFFANLLMVMISNEYKKVFPGEGVFYVDDSVLFTKGKEGKLDSKIFAELVELLNDNIAKEEKNIVVAGANRMECILPRDFCYADTNFGIRIHKPAQEGEEDSKSYFATIDDAAKNDGERYLHGLSRETSNISFDIRTVLSDAEAEMMMSRVEAISELVDSEIKRIRDDSREKVYLKKLIRYKKFFAYRKNILRYRATGDISKLKDLLLKDIALRGQEDKKKFYEKYTDDILASAILFVLQRCINEAEDVQELRKAVENLVFQLYGVHTKHAYIMAVCQPYFKNGINCSCVDPYQTIREILQQRYCILQKQAQVKRWEWFSKLRACSACELFAMVKLDWLYKLSSAVSCNAEIVTRMLLNGIFSYLFEFEMDDGFVFSKHSKNPIQYAEVRVLAELRNHEFQIGDFWLHYCEYTRDDYMCTVDYLLLQVLEVFKTFVGTRQEIDELIQIHKYCCDTWKNGSKHLHFYTLHNQEHAVTLIRLCVRWLHAISFFELKKLDYFILFAACYLHDISMVTLPDPKQFYASQDFGADEIFTAISNKFSSGEKQEVTKRDLYETYQRIDAFFEQKVRGSHAADSAQEIVEFDELSFLDPTMRQTIAQVSKAHGDRPEDVYLEKSSDLEPSVNKKLIKILLRLSDLLDMSRYRISKVLLNHNLKSLNEVSRFHWISHLITDQCDIDAHYRLKIDNAQKTKMKRRIEEKLILTVDVLMLQTTMTSPDYCKHICGVKFEEKSRVVICCAQDKQCTGRECNFLCKWFMRKNNYLAGELAALKEYLRGIEENFFAADIEIHIRVVENQKIPNEVFDYLEEYVEAEKTP